MNRLRNLLLGTGFALLSLTTKAQENQLTQTEKQQGWQLLFDGKTTEGWKSASKEGFPQKGWKVEGGTLSVEPKAGGGDIVTLKEYGDFELSVDFKLTEGANSGIKYYVAFLKSSPTATPSALGLEYQLIDDERHPDAKLGKNGNRRLAAVYDLMPAGSTKKAKPLGEWNTARIVSKGNHVEHWLNGVRVLQYERNSSAFKQLIAQSKYKDIAGFGINTRGHILLQDHGDQVYYRNIRIKAGQ